MDRTDKAARIAGWLYLAMAVPAPFSLMYVPNKLIVAGNAAATASNVLAHETLFRAGIAVGLLSCTIFLFTGVALFRLFKDVNQTYAMAMVALVAISVGIGFLNEVTNLGALALFRGSEYLSVFDKPQREALGLLFVRLNAQGTYLNEMFWGLWLLPFGALVMKSRFLPRILGVLLIVNGAAYVAQSFMWILAPAYGPAVWRAIMPALLGELWIMLWLLIKGAKTESTAMSAAA